MTDPMHVSEVLAKWLALVAELGPYLVRLEVSPRQYANLQRRVTPDRRPDLHTKLASVDVRVVEDLVPGAVRLHWSDGRVVTRYRKVLDPRVLQVRLHDHPYANPPGGPERHGLSLMVRTERHGWVHANRKGRALTSSWKGPRVSAYLPGLAGITLAPWQRDYLGALSRLRAAEAYRPSSVIVPRFNGGGLQ